jgi:hypothetical protein
VGRTITCVLAAAPVDVDDFVDDFVDGDGDGDLAVRRSSERSSTKSSSTVCRAPRERLLFGSDEVGHVAVAVADKVNVHVIDHDHVDVEVGGALGVG